jgi:hypothetical protein
MAQLVGVKTVSEGAIEYDGNRYVEAKVAADIGDIVRQDDRQAGPHHPFGAYFVITEIDSDEDRVYSDNDGDNAYVDLDFTVFRRAGIALTTAQLIEQKRVELAELEAKLADETTLKVGDYARVTVSGECDSFPEGYIVFVAEIREGAPYPVKVASPFDADLADGVRADQLAKLTPAEARAALIAQIDALFVPVSP